MEKRATLEASFEEMTVSPTPGSPIAPDMPVEPAPKDKITFQVEIIFKEHTTRKAVRILPSSSMHDLLDKLTKKKYMPTTSELGGPLKTEQIAVSFGSKRDELVALPMTRWPEPIWNSGFRDKFILIVNIDENHSTVEENADSQKNRDAKVRKSSSDEGRNSSIIGKFRRSIKNIGAESEQICEEKSLLFGRPLEEIADKGVPLMASYGIPAFIEESLETITKKYLKTEGVFRLSGSLVAIRALKKKIDAGLVPPFDADTDVHCLTGLIKLYLRELPEPILTYALYDAWRAAGACEIPEKKMELVKALLAAIPKSSYILLKRIVGFFFEFAKFEEFNKMGLKNLSTLMGPNLLWNHDITDITTPMRIAWYLISNCETIFGDPEVRTTVFLAIGRAKYNFQPENTTEILLKAGDFVFVTDNDHTGDGWLEGMPADSIQHGKFPAKYFEPVAIFAGFNEKAVSKSSSRMDSPVSLVPSSIQIDELSTELTNLKFRLSEEENARAALEEQVQTMQANFSDMIHIVCNLKDHLKQLKAVVDDLVPYEDVEESPAAEEKSSSPSA